LHFEKKEQLIKSPYICILKPILSFLSWLKNPECSHLEQFWRHPYGQAFLVPRQKVGEKTGKKLSSFSSIAVILQQ
jgi:hypothetical protein